MPQSPPQVGEKLDKYSLIERVGQGGMASVFRARDEDLDRDVAVKVLHPHLEGREDARLRFRREAKTIARITHPNIVAIYDYSGEDSETSFIATQFVDGPQLRQLMERDGPLPAELAASMARQIAEGLVVAHADGIVHRDIKPENILVSGDGLLKIADFGIALMADTQDLTATGQILGSPYYMSPDHVQCRNLDARADIFSFGSLLYWLVTGKNAFEGPNPHAVLQRICDGEPEPPDRLAPPAGQAMADIILTCLTKDRDERPMTLEPVVEALDRYLEDSGVEDPVDEVREFLKDPDAYRDEHRDRVIRALTRSGDRKHASRDHRGAMDAWNRILALDPENGHALARVRDVASSRSRRRLLTRLGVVAASAAAVLALVFWAPRLLEAFERRQGTGPVALVDDAATQADAAPAGEKRAPDTAPDAGEAADAPGEPAAGDARPIGKKVVIGRPIKKTGQKVTVKFVPMPKTVDIWVDGKKVGDYYDHQTMELSVGKHRIRFEPQDPDCCEAAEWDVNVLEAKADGKPQAIGRRLAFKPATIVVFTDKPVKVLLDGKNAGVNGKPISVPMGGEYTRSVELTLVADGYETVTRKVKLKAGETLDLPQIKMKPAE